VPRSVKDIKHRWDDMKRRTKDKLAFMQKSLMRVRQPVSFPLYDLKLQIPAGPQGGPKQFRNGRMEAFLHTHAQQTEVLRQFCQELVTVHRDMANGMQAIGQAMAELTSRVSQMCQTLTEIRDGVQASQRGPDGAAPTGSTPQAEAPPVEPPEALPAPAHARTTRSRKRKHSF
ncbi:hypothetical protein E2I00_014334, partial [Balaenoptera physalus]